ncbi:MAG TPA: alpha/beta fold hydrolase [Burkholderiaceae bacterium]|nr:alpha/beta fold hydrolase [Burkholderiaceae bacterium]
MNDAERLAIRLDRVGPAEMDTALTLVLLPPAASTAEDFVREGFLDDLDACGIAATVVRSEVPVDMYAADSVVALLRHRVLHPLRAGASDRLWLVGISLGGMTALACAEAHRDLVDGVFAIAPWPGLRPLWSDVPEEGGIMRWAARHADACFDDERRVWRWLGEGALGGPEVVLGYGRQDRFLEGQQLLAEALPATHRLLLDGAHDWSTWRALWRRFLAQNAPRWLPQPAGNPGPRP